MSSNKRLIVIGVAALILNAIVLLVVIPEVSGRLTTFYNQNNYPDGYEQIASNLVAGNGYRFYPDTAKTLMREPGYPLFLAGIFLVFGKSFTAVKLANMFLALTAAWLMTRIARKLSPSPWLTVAAPLVFLFHPGTLIAESRGGSEMLFTLLLTLFAWTVLRAIERNRTLDYVVSGGVLGLTVLVRSTPMLFPVVLLAYLLFLQRQGNARLVVRHVVSMVIAMVIVLSPWIIRNYSLTGRFAPTASVVGVSAYTGLYVCERSSNFLWVDENLDRDAGHARTVIGQELGYHFTGDYYQIFYSSGDELRFSDDLMKRVISDYRRSPMLFARCAGSNLFNLWFAGKTQRSTLINLTVQLPFLALAIVGAVLSLRSNHSRMIAPLALFIIYYVAVHLPILAQARYSVALIPLVSILACLALLAVHKKLTGEDRVPARPLTRATI